MDYIERFNELPELVQNVLMILGSGLVILLCMAAIAAVLKEVLGMIRIFLAKTWPVILAALLGYTWWYAETKNMVEFTSFF